MNYLWRIGALFVVSVGVIVSVFLTVHHRYSLELQTTQSEQYGVVYIQMLNHVGIDAIRIQTSILQKASQTELFKLQNDLEGDIVTLFSLQKEHALYQNKIFNQKLSLITSLHESDFLFTFIDELNKEIYRVGDVSKLLFEADRTLYFLGSLLTHYMPEYLLSILLTDNMMQEYAKRGALSATKKKRFLEERKLVRLSTEEVYEIIVLLTSSLQETKLLKKIKVLKELVSQLPPSTLIFAPQTKNRALKSYLSYSKRLVKESLVLNELYIDTTLELLEKRAKDLKQSILYAWILLILALFGVTFFAYMVYHTFRINQKKDAELKKTSQELDKVVLFASFDKTGRLTHVSHALLKLSAYEAYELIGKPYTVFKHEKCQDETYRDLWEMIQAKIIWRGELINRRKDGSTFWTQTTISPNMNAKGEIESFSMHHIDITDFKALEEEKEKTQKLLRFRSRFLSNMSHEIRTPLNGIIGLTDVLAKTQLDEKQKGIILQLKSSSELLLGIINDILDLSKIEAGKMTIEQTSFHLKELIHTIESTMMVKAKEKGLTFKSYYHELKHLYFKGDPLRLTQILNNLLSNAIKFTKEGEVSIHIFEEANKGLRFEVRDTGIGLKKEAISRLFEEFTQADMSTSRKFGGTGLGLSISKHLVGLMGGKIWVESTYGKGSNFIFTLPLEVDESRKEKSDDEKEHFADLEAKVLLLEDKQILVAEDNKTNQMVLKLLLEKTTLKLDFAEDGLQAVEAFKSKAYDMVLMDIQMPNMNGYEATKKIREFNKETPIVGLSANVMQEDIQKGMQSGMNDYLAKPIEISKLYAVLLKYLA